MRKRGWQAVARAALALAATLACGCGHRTWLRVTVDSDDRPAIDHLVITVTAGGATSRPALLSSPPQGVPIVFALELDDSIVGEAIVDVTAELLGGGTRTGRGSTPVVPRRTSDLSVWIGLGAAPGDGGGDGRDGGGGDGPPSGRCDNVAQDGTESDVDCGGSTCGPCPAGKRCTSDGDCRSGRCDGATCAGFDPIGPWGGAVTSIAFAPTDPSTAIATALNRVYRTRDGGRGWRALDWDRSGETWIHAVAFDPTKPGTAYVRTMGRLLQTTDGGDHFAPVVLRPDLPALEIDYPPVAPLAIASGGGTSTLYVGSNEGVWVSTDKESAIPGLKGQRITAIAVDPDEPRRVFAASDRGEVSLTSDAGQSWSPMAAFPNGDRAKVQGLAATGGGTIHLYAATTSGLLEWDPAAAAAWRAVKLPVDNLPCAAVLLDPADRRRVVAACGGRVFRRQPGASWTELKGTDVVGETYTLAMPATGSSAVWLGTAAGAHRADVVVGNGFEPATVGIDAWTVLSLTFDPNDARRIWVVVRSYGRDGLIYRSDDAGGSWSRVATSFAQPTAVLAVAHGALTTLHVAHQELDASMRVSSSTDGGGKFDPPVRVGSGPGYLYQLYSDPADPDVLYAVEGAEESDGVFRSTTAGRDFVPDSAGLPPSPISGAPALCAVRRLAFDDKGNLFAATGCGAFRRDAVKASWIDVSGNKLVGLPERDLLTVAWSPPAAVLLATLGRRPWAGRNLVGGAATWTPLDEPAGINVAYSIEAHPADTTVIWLGSDQGMCFTSSGGVGGLPTTWRQQRIDDEVVHLRIPDAKAPTTVYAGTFSRGLWKNTRGSL